MVQVTTATNKLLQLNKKIRAVSGGTGASKTFSIMMILTDYCQSNDNMKVDVVSESYPHLEDGAISDFKKIMIARKYWNDKRWNETKHTYQFETGTTLKFISFDNLGKAHGPRRDVLFVNEGNYLPFKIIDQLITRTRKIVWLDWNPSEEFWFYTEMLGKREDIDFLGDGGNYPPLTYLDNEALSEEEISEIESRKHNKQWWRVYGQGLLGELEGKIYTGWKIIDEISHEARLERRGLDFGFTNDPTVIEDLYSYNGGFIIDELCYQKGLSNKSIADILGANGRGNVLTLADSAEPKSIDEIKNYGINIVGAIKGPGSIYQGIQYVQGQRISVTSRSTKTIKAYRNYLFRIDKNGNVTNDPDDTVHEWSNPMDAIRYGFSEYRPQRKKSSNCYIQKKDSYK